MIKILYVTTIGITMRFFETLIKELIDEGNIVDIATNEQTEKVPNCYHDWGCKIYPISTSRSPFSIGNYKAIREIREIAKDYHIVHCHTPLAGMATRLACRKLRASGLKVIYTAHGFHFYEGAPLINWLIFYPIEKICAKCTDVLITITKEDFDLARKNMSADRIEYVPGVGIDVESFANRTVDKNSKRKEVGIPEGALVLLSVGELNENKNHITVIKAISKMKSRNVHYVIAGKGDLKECLCRQAQELEIVDKIHLLGYRNDVCELYKISDFFVSPSFREGLSVSIMESLASGVPVICSKIRGNTDMIINGYNGYFANPYDVDSFCKVIGNAISINYSLENNCVASSSRFDYNIINNKMKEIYYQEEIALEIKR